MWQRVTPGQRIGPYELKEELGHGGSAVVYKAFHRSRKRYVALKLIAAGYAADETFRARFRREAELFARLRHPHVLQVIESGDTGRGDSGVPGGLAYLVTEYMAGGNLADQLRQERTPKERALLALAVAEQIGSALDWAHAADVLHRDVKPSNILIAADGRLVLGDFGLARALGHGASIHSTVTGHVAGTPAYMAPEQALGEPADARTDLYGLAVVIYEIVVGRVPFYGETPLATMLAHVHRPVPTPHELQCKAARPIETVLVRALAKSRDERYQSGAALSVALRHALARSYGESEIATGVYPVIRSPGDVVPQAAAGPAGPPRPVPARRRLAGTTSADGPAPVRTAGDTAPAVVIGYAPAATLPGASPDGEAPAGPRAMTRTRRAPRRRLPFPMRLAAAAASVVVLVAVTTGGASLVAGSGRPALSWLMEQLAADSGQPRVERILAPARSQAPTLRPSFTLLFNTKMEQESVERAVRLEPAVALDFEWHDPVAIVIVTPQVDLRPGTTYKLIVEDTATDIEGRRLAKSESLEFVTAPETPTPPTAEPLAPPTVAPPPPPSATPVTQATWTVPARSPVPPTPTLRPASPTPPPAAQEAAQQPGPASGSLAPHQAGGTTPPAGADGAPAPAEAGAPTPVPEGQPAPAATAPSRAEPASPDPAAPAAGTLGGVASAPNGPTGTPAPAGTPGAAATPPPAGASGPAPQGTSTAAATPRSESSAVYSPSPTPYRPSQITPQPSAPAASTPATGAGLSAGATQAGQSTLPPAPANAQPSPTTHPGPPGPAPSRTVTGRGGE